MEFLQKTHFLCLYSIIVHRDLVGQISVSCRDGHAFIMQRWARVPECLFIPRDHVPGFCLPAFLYEIFFFVFPCSCFAFLRRRGGGKAHGGSLSWGPVSSERRHLGVLLPVGAGTQPDHPSPLAGEHSCVTECM